MPKLIIDDTTPLDVTHNVPFARGAVPRDYNIQPVTMFQSPSEMPDMSLDEIAERIKEQQATKSSLRHLRRRPGPWGSHVPAYDQNGQGYCWSYSTGGVLLYTRIRDNQPYKRFSPHAVACKIKNFRDEGGWCGLSAEFARKFGYPDEAFWPQKSMSRSNDNPQTWANASLHKTDEEWVDLAKPVYDQNMTKKQVLINLVMNNPCALDFNWWSHSVLAIIALLRGNRTNYVIQDFGEGIVNSWTDSWGDLGEAELWDSKSVPDGAVCIRSSTISRV